MMIDTTSEVDLGVEAQGKKECCGTGEEARSLTPDPSPKGEGRDYLQEEWTVEQF